MSLIKQAELAAERVAKWPLWIQELAAVRVAQPGQDTQL